METNENPTKVSIPRPERSSRILALCTLLFFIPKAILLIPHFIALWALGIAAFVVGVIAQVVVLFTGTYPESLHRFVVGTIRWQTRVNAYAFGLRDEYPPFTFED